MVKKDRNSDIQKREICLTNFEKGTLIEKYTKSKIVYNIFTHAWTMWKTTSH